MIQKTILFFFLVCITARAADTAPLLEVSDDAPKILKDRVRLHNESRANQRSAMQKLAKAAAEDLEIVQSAKVEPTGLSFSATLAARPHLVGTISIPTRGTVTTKYLTAKDKVEAVKHAKSRIAAVRAAQIELQQAGSLEFTKLVWPFRNGKVARMGTAAKTAVKVIEVRDETTALCEVYFWRELNKGAEDYVASARQAFVITDTKDLKPGITITLPITYEVVEGPTVDTPTIRSIDVAKFLRK